MANEGKFIIQQTGFSAGEISPRLRGAMDLEKYAQGCSVCQNTLVTLQGSLLRRSGTIYAGTAKVGPSTGSCVLIPFTFSQGDAYVIEATPGFFRYYQNGVLITTSAQTISAATRALVAITVTGGSSVSVAGFDQVTLTIGAHTFQSGDSVFVANVLNSLPAAGGQKFGWNNDVGTLWTILSVTTTTITYNTTRTFGAATWSSGGTASQYQDAFTVASAAGMSVGDSVTTASVLSSPTGNLNESGTIISIVGAVVSIRATSSVATTYISGGIFTDTSVAATVASTATPYTAAADVTLLQWAQSNDVLYLTHPTIGIYKLTRANATTFTLTAVCTATTAAISPSTNILLDGPYQSINASAITMTPSATTGASTITASASYFAASDVGRALRIKNGTNWGWGIITAFTNATTVTCTVTSAFAATTASLIWQIGSFSSTSGFPQAITFFQQRLWFGGTTVEPQTIWASVTNDFEDFAPTGTPRGTVDTTVSASNGIAAPIAATQQNVITWLSSDRVLLVGTTSGPYWVAGDQSTNAVTPVNISIRATSGNPCEKNVLPVRIGIGTFYVQKNGRKLRRMLYQYQYDNYVANDLTILSEHITAPAIDTITLADQPNNILWASLTDGTLAALTYELDQGIQAWHKHTLGGTYSGGNAFVESICSIPGTTYSPVYFSVLRTINGATARYIEYFAREFDSNVTSLTNYVGLDAALSGTAASATTAWSGLTHLVGQSVYALADGAVQGPFTVNSSGAITLTQAASVVTIGLPYVALVEGLPISTTNKTESWMGAVTQIQGIVVRLMDTGGLVVGTETNDENEIAFHAPSSGTLSIGGGALSSGNAGLFEGDKFWRLTSQTYDPAGNNGFVRWVIQDDGPLPFNVLAIATMVDVHQGA